MKNVKAEDSVYCMVRGEGKVIFVCQDTIRVVFNPCLGTVDFNLDGTCKEFGWEGAKRTLYYSEPEFDIPPEPERPVYLHGHELRGFIKNHQQRRKQIYVVALSNDELVTNCHINDSCRMWDYWLEHKLAYPYSPEGFANAVRHAQILLGVYKEEAQQTFDNFESGDNIL